MAAFGTVAVVAYSSACAWNGRRKAQGRPSSPAARSPRGGLADARELERLVDLGEVETVLVVFPDHYGRFMGKRLTGAFFLDSVAGTARTPATTCLTVDMEMDARPGLRVRELGAGLRRLPPACPTSARCGVATLARPARRSCCATSSTTEPHEPGARRAALDPATPGRARRGSRLHRARPRRELEYYLFRRLLPRRRAQGLRRPRAGGLVPRGLPPAAGHAREEPSTAPCAATSRDRASRSRSQGRVGPRPARAEHALRRRARRWPTATSIYKQCLKEIADAQGASASPSWPSRRRPGRLELPHPPEPVGRRRDERVPGRRSSAPVRRARTSSAGSSAAGSRHVARLHALLRARRELLQALPGRLVGADAPRLEPRQPHRRLPRRRQGPEPAHRVPHPRRRLQPLPRLRRRARRRASTASRSRSSRRRCSRATCTPRRTCPQVPAHACARRSRRLRTQRASRARPSATTSSSTTPTSSATEQKRSTTQAVTDWERQRYFERI